MVPEPLIIPLSSTLMPPVSGTLEPNQRDISPVIDRQRKFISVLFMIAVWSPVAFLSFPFSSHSLSLSSFSSSALDCDLTVSLHSPPTLSLSLSPPSSFIPPLERAALSLCSSLSHNSWWQERLDQAWQSSGWQREESQVSFKALSLMTIYKLAQFDRKYWMQLNVWH